MSSKKIRKTSRGGPFPITSNGEPAISKGEIRRRIARKAYELDQRYGWFPGHEVGNRLEAARMVMAELGGRDTRRPQPDSLVMSFGLHEFNVEFFREED